MGKKSMDKETLSELLLPNNKNCFKEELIEFDQIIDECKCTICTDKKLDRNDDSLTITKRIVNPADTKNESEISADGTCEKIKIKIPFDSNASMGK